MCELYEARNSVYCYKDSDVLKNNLDIRDNKKLLEVERKITMAKLFELRQNNQIKNFDKEHFISIHKFLFEDLYPFAGKFRSENIGKGNFCFAESRFIDSELDRLLLQLKREQYLSGLNKVDISKRLAYYMAELNVLHPFREGNGRTIREFIRQLAYKNGFVLDLQRVDPKDMLNASIKSVIDTTDLERVMYNCLDKEKNKNIEDDYER